MCDVTHEATPWAVCKHNRRPMSLHLKGSRKWGQRKSVLAALIQAASSSCKASSDKSTNMDGLLNIEISDDEQEAKKARRTGQTEEDFQAIRATYRPKIENGNVSFFLLNLHPPSLGHAANLPPKSRFTRIYHFR